MSDWEELPDVASERLGGAATACSDDFFAPMENLVRAAAPVFREHDYTDRGKWMDGWESRRKRAPGHDWCVVRLGAPAVVRGVVVDTSFFRGNFPSHASLDGCFEREPLAADAPWIELVPKTELRGDAKNALACRGAHLVSHVRLNIFPDGGVARLRVHGEVLPDFRRLGGGGADFDLAAIDNGGRSLACSDMFFGVRHNLLMPGRAASMADGWETRRRRGPGHDWNLVRLAGRARVRALEIDTSHFKGNYPDACSVEVCDGDPAGAEWRELLARTRLAAHTRHVFVEEIVDADPATHLRLNVFPDGGVSRLRAFGTLTEDARVALGLARVAALPRAACERELRACCGSRAWAAGVAAERPFSEEEDLCAASDRVWLGLERADWLEAFAAHPPIGGHARGAWSREEQRGVSVAPPGVLAELAAANERYKEKFGHVFLVCATGKSADEMLATLRARLGNDAARELEIAAEEQRKITRLRLAKLVRA